MNAPTDVRAVSSDSLDPAAVAALKQHLLQISPGGAAAIDADTPLLSGGRLDSMGVLQLVGFLEETFGIEVADDDFTEENFATVGTLLAFVARRTGAPGAPGAR